MIAGDNAHRPTGPLNEPGIIGGRSAAGVGLLEHLTQEPLRGLYAAQRVTIRSCQHAAWASITLTVSVTGSPGTTAEWPARTASMTLANRSDGARHRATS